MVTVDMASVSYMSVPQQEPVQMDFPKRRTLPSWWIFLFYIVYILIVLCSSKIEKTGPEVTDPFQLLVEHLAPVLFNVAIGAAIYIIASLICEYNHVKPQRFRDFKRRIIFVLKELKVVAITVITGLFLFILLQCKQEEPQKISLKLLYTSPVGLLYLYFLKNQSWRTSQIQRCSTRLRSIGKTIAFGSWFGYYKIILEDKNPDSLHQRIQNFEEEHSVYIPVKKLFIVLPVSCHVNSDLSQSRKLPGQNYLERINQLRSKELERGSVNRKYDNTVYKIWPHNVNLVAEIATPLVTLYDMSESAVCQFLNKDQLKEQFELFCIQLKELLENDKRCEDTYVLVYYDDLNGECLADCLYQHWCKEEQTHISNRYVGEVETN